MAVGLRAATSSATERRRRLDVAAHGATGGPLPERRASAPIDYRGPLDQRHLQAVARAALRAAGLRLDVHGLEHGAARQAAVGRWLRDVALAGYLPAFVEAQDARRIAAQDPYLWERVARAAGFGYRLAEELDGLTRTPPDETVAVVGGAFNAAITAIDYVVDETAAGPTLLETLDDDLVASIFTSPAIALQRLEAAYRAEAAPERRLALTLVGACIAGFWQLYRAGREVAGPSKDAVWRALGGLVLQLRQAVAASVPGAPVPGAPDAPDPGGIRGVVEAKGSLPARVVLQLSLLATGADPSAQIRETAARLGRVLCLVDDIADLSRDLRRAAPSTAVLDVARLAAERRSPWAADADLYDAIVQRAGEVVSLVAELPGPRRRGAPRGRPGPDRVAPSDTAGSGMRAFATALVGDWIGWPPEEAFPSQVPTLADPLHAAATEAVRYLLDDRARGYAEAAHHLRFPRVVAGRIVYETHPALLYPRSLILGALARAARAGVPVPREVLDAEALSILRDKHRQLRGGWSYIPVVVELPPDSDDLGVVLRALVAVGGQDLAAACDEPIRLALDAAGTSGGFPTWILDPRGASPADRASAAYLRVIGGLGVHPDAVAHLLHALLEYDPTRFGRALARGASYLESIQEPSGAWTSKWYAGPFFATWHAAWVLRTMAPGSAALAKAARFLLASQLASGAWGEPDGTPTATALAVCALAAFGRDDGRAAAERGIRFLVDEQDEDGGWSASPFIEFATADGIETYSSRTTTTALCLEAILAHARDAPEDGRNAARAPEADPVAAPAAR